MRPLGSTKRLGVSFKMRPIWTRWNSSGVLTPVVSFKSTQLAEEMGRRRVTDVTRESRIPHILQQPETHYQS